MQHYSERTLLLVTKKKKIACDFILDNIYACRKGKGMRMQTPCTRNERKRGRKKKKDTQGSTSVANDCKLPSPALWNCLELFNWSGTAADCTLRCLKITTAESKQTTKLPSLSNVMRVHKPTVLSAYVLLRRTNKLSFHTACTTRNSLWLQWQAENHKGGV